ncbi:hypothetical protein NDU88_000747 [Pleurodeles waltl]|uniref:Alpha-macroglobulin-like TED domain-containing protein n=1 Tax=Pleurodeles waltl TaxID=8319 RepID=A0AAV7P1W5_PLEWA|nr:hypothetical protein NDU88_000747 [Pleurodeles waltl]
MMLLSGNRKNVRLELKMRNIASHFISFSAGYQRQLNYKHDDGSYSAFGKSDQEGNTWLTAFVMKSFGQAWDDVYVDKVYIDQALKYLKEYQLESVCFNSSGKLLNNTLKGGVEDNLSLSAYITAAMLELGRIHTVSPVRAFTGYVEEEDGREPLKH